MFNKLINTGGGGDTPTFTLSNFYLIGTKQLINPTDVSNGNGSTWNSDGSKLIYYTRNASGSNSYTYWWDAPTNYDVFSIDNTSINRTASINQAGTTWMGENNLNNKLTFLANFVTAPTRVVNTFNHSTNNSGGIGYSSGFTFPSISGGGPSGGGLSLDGRWFYTGGYSSNSITTYYQYELTTPWDFSTITFRYTQNLSDLASGLVRTIQVNDTGTKMFICYTTSIQEYILSTPFDIRTATYSGNTVSHTYAISSLWTPDGSRYHVVIPNGTLYVYNTAK